MAMRASNFRQLKEVVCLSTSRSPLRMGGNQASAPPPTSYYTRPPLMKRNLVCAPQGRGATNNDADFVEIFSKISII